MADHSKIEWTDATWNPITGCSVFSPGCTNCYAMKLAGTRLQHHPSRIGLTQPTKAGPVWTGEVRFNEEWLTQPLQWKKPRRIFVCAHGDLFHESVPDEWIDRVFAVMALAPQHTFQVLTKRSARMRQRVSNMAAMGAPYWGHVLEGMLIKALGGAPPPPWPLSNVMLGVSVEDQTRADERIPDLLATPAAVRFISAEPLLGDLDVSQWLHDEGCGTQAPWCTCEEPREIRIDWVIAGGESGPGARPMHPDWARSLRDQCAAVGVPFHFKQWGEWQPRLWKADGGTHALHSRAPGSFQKLGHHPNSCERTSADAKWQAFARVGKGHAGRLLDGRTHDGFPA